MWRTSPPIVTAAWATGWPWLIACPSGRGVTVTVTGVPGQALNLWAAHPPPPFGQVIPKDGDVYLGAPGAVLDGQGINRAAFTQLAKDVVIRGLTIQNFVAPQDQDGMTDVNPINSIPSHHPTLQDCLLAGRTGIIADPCRKPRTAKRRPAMGDR